MVGEMIQDCTHMHIVGKWVQLTAVENTGDPQPGFLLWEA